MSISDIQLPSSTFRAGTQRRFDAEIISPLNPATLDSGAGMCVGNVGYRRGVMRVDQRNQSPGR